MSSYFNILGNGQSLSLPEVDPFPQIPLPLPHAPWALCIGISLPLGPQQTP